MKRLRGNQRVYLVLLTILGAGIMFIVLVGFLLRGQEADYPPITISPRHYLHLTLLLALFITDRFRLFYANIIFLACWALFFAAGIPRAFINDGLTLWSTVQALGSGFLVFLVVGVFMAYPWEILKRSRGMRRQT